MEFKEPDSNLIEIGQQDQKLLEDGWQTDFQTAKDHNLSCTPCFPQEAGVEKNTADKNTILTV